MSNEKIAELLADSILKQGSLEKEAIAPFIGAGVAALKSLGPKLVGGAKSIGELGKAQGNLMKTKSKVSALNKSGISGPSKRLDAAIATRNQAFSAAAPSLMNVGLVGSGAALGSAINSTPKEASIVDLYLEKEANVGKTVKKYVEDLSGTTRRKTIAKAYNDTSSETADFIGKMHGMKHPDEEFVDMTNRGIQRLHKEDKALAKQEAAKVGTGTLLGVGVGALGHKMYQGKRAKEAGYAAAISLMEKSAGFRTMVKNYGKHLSGKTRDDALYSLKNDVLDTGEALEKEFNAYRKTEVVKDAVRKTDEMSAKAKKNIASQEKARTATGSIIGAGAGAAGATLFNHERNKQAADIYIDALLQKQAALETMAESRLIAEASEKALNRLGYSMFAKE